MGKVLYRFITLASLGWCFLCHMFGTAGKFSWNNSAVSGWGYWKCIVVILFFKKNLPPCFAEIAQFFSLVGLLLFCEIPGLGLMFHGGLLDAVSARHSQSYCVSPVLPVRCAPTQLVGMQLLQGCKNQVGFSHQLLLHKEDGARTADQGAGNISWTLRNPFSSSQSPRQWEAAAAWSDAWQEQEYWRSKSDGYWGQQRKEGFITGRKLLKHWHFKTF